jgi:hypothetical protein
MVNGNAWSAASQASGQKLMQIFPATPANKRPSIEPMAMMTPCASLAYAADLIFLTEAVNPGSGKTYKAYIDKSTIAFPKSQGAVIVDEKDPDAPDEPIGEDTVNTKIVPYLCTNPSAQ